jgi:hypothetical protein
MIHAAAQQQQLQLHALHCWHMSRLCSCSAPPEGITPSGVTPSGQNPQHDVCRVISNADTALLRLQSSSACAACTMLVLHSLAACTVAACHFWACGCAQRPGCPGSCNRNAPSNIQQPLTSTLMHAWALNQSHLGACKRGSNCTHTTAAPVVHPRPAQRRNVAPVALPTRVKEPSLSGQFRAGLLRLAYALTCAAAQSGATAV